MAVDCCPKLKNPKIRAIQDQNNRDVTPRVIGCFDGYIWGSKEAFGARQIWRTADGGITWEFFNAEYPDIGDIQILKTSDGEVLWVGTQAIHKSTGWAQEPTALSFSLVLTTGTATEYVLPWGVDGDGDKFIVTTYSPTRADSHLTWISTDQGDTWTEVFDSDTVSADPSDSHGHAACYDPWDDRFIYCEGHGDGVGIYISENDGTDWTKSSDANNTMGTDGPSPTVAVATPNGVILGSDNGNGGISVIPRGETDPVMLYEWRDADWPDNALIGFANQGSYDPISGLTHISYRSNFADVGGWIGVSDGVTAGAAFTGEEGQVFSNLQSYDGNIMVEDLTAIAPDSQIYMFTNNDYPGNRYTNYMALENTAYLVSNTGGAGLDINGDFEFRWDVDMNQLSGAQYGGGIYGGTIMRYYLSGTVNIVFQLYDRAGGNQLFAASQPLSSTPQRVQYRFVCDLDGYGTHYLRTNDDVLRYPLDHDGGWYYIGRQSVNVPSIADASSSEVYVSNGSAAINLDGKHYRMMIFDGIGPSKSVLVDVNMQELSPTVNADGSFVESGSLGLTMTLTNGAEAVYQMPLDEKIEQEDLWQWILANRSADLATTDTELVGALNELNGTEGVEYAQARGTYPRVCRLPVKFPVSRLCP